MRRRWSRGQWIILLIGMVAVVGNLLYPPFTVCSGFFCGAENHYYKTTMDQFIAAGADDPVQLDAPLYVCEILLLLWTTAMVILLLDWRTTKSLIVRELAAGEVGIIVLVAARECLEWHAFQDTNLSSLLYKVVWLATAGGFDYTCPPTLSALVLMLVSVVRLVRMRRERPGQSLPKPGTGAWPPQST